MQIWVFVMVCEWSLCMKLLLILISWWRVRIDLKTVKLLPNQHKLRNCAALPIWPFARRAISQEMVMLKIITPQKRKILWQSDVNIPKNLSFRIGILSNTVYNCAPFIFTLYKCYIYAIIVLSKVKCAECYIFQNFASARFILQMFLTNCLFQHSFMFGAHYFYSLVLVLLIFLCSESLFGCSSSQYPLFFLCPKKKKNVSVM